MAEEILINVHPFETRVALVTHGLLQEVHIARSAGYSVTGNIYLGKVDRIVPGMQAAFVDIGLQRPGFLHARDIESPRIFTAQQADDEPHKLDIRAQLHEGQTVMVQVEKDPISSKGARLSTQLAVASKYLVFMPNEQHIGISQRIEEETERERLRDCLSAAVSQSASTCGLIARTAAEHVDEVALQADLQLLKSIWARIQKRRESSAVPGLVFEELPLHTRMIRELASASTQSIFIDDEPTFSRIHSYVTQFIPDYVNRLQHYEEKRPLFERHGVEDELARALGG